MTKKLFSQLANSPPLVIVTPLGPKPAKVPLATGFSAQRRTEPKRVQSFVHRRRGK